MTYREMAIEVAKILGRELVERAEELIPNTEGVKDIDIWVHIPSLSDNEFNIPEIQVNTNVYPKHVAVEKIVKMISGNSMRLVKRE